MSVEGLRIGHSGRGDEAGTHDRAQGGGFHQRTHSTGYTYLGSLTPKPCSTEKRGNGGAWARVRARTHPLWKEGRKEGRERERES